MHLGYHELRNLLQKFKEERDARKASGPPPSSATSGLPPSSGARPGERDYRSSRDDYRDRDRDRGYDREKYSSRYEYVSFLFVSNPFRGLFFFVLTP